MKATLDERGTLLVSAETPIEAFALKRWSQDYFQTHLDQSYCPVGLMIQASVETSAKE